MTGATWFYLLGWSMIRLFCNNFSLRRYTFRLRKQNSTILMQTQWRWQWINTCDDQNNVINTNDDKIVLVEFFKTISVSFAWLPSHDSHFCEVIRELLSSMGFTHMFQAAATVLRESVRILKSSIGSQTKNHYRNEDRNRYSRVVGNDCGKMNNKFLLLFLIIYY